MAPHSDPLPPCAAPFADELAAIEEELDTLWPGYAREANIVPTGDGGRVCREGYKLKGRPFTVNGIPAAPYRMEHVRRLKWLLKRHVLLMGGEDIGVHIAAGAGRQLGRCYAHPTGTVKPHPEPPPRVAPPSFTIAMPAPSRPQATPEQAIASLTPYGHQTQPSAPPARSWRP